MLSAIIRRWQCSRWSDIEFRKKLRQISFSKRISFIAVCLFLSIYLLISLLPSSSSINAADLCLKEQLRHWKLREERFSVSTNDKLQFVGNGFIGIGNDEELRIRLPYSRVLSMLTSFFPLISFDVDTASTLSTAHITDYTFGLVKRIQCFSVNEKCVCLTRVVYAHRSRPHVLIQELTTSNPSDGAITINLKRKESNLWKSESVGNSVVYSRTLEHKGVRIAIATVCSSVPQNILVEQKREDSSRFTCIFNYDTISANDSEESSRASLGKLVIKEFFNSMSISSSAIDREHETAWSNLNVVTVGLSKSLAPNTLNPDAINSTRYALLSNVRDIMLESNLPEQKRKEVCYTGHSTLLYPSRLWRATKTVKELIEKIDLWILTLEKRGCSNLVKAGAGGLAEAFALSLFASKFSGEHLEIGIDPADLHREMTLDNLQITSAAKVAISIHLDSENRPYFLVSSSSALYACDAGCLDEPVALNNLQVRIPVKVTRPLTPILYLSENKKHLQQLHGTIHVVEVGDAPAHEHDLIALHKHGHRLGGLPAMFWVFLFALVVIFHLFLFKLVYQEWKKSDTTPYNYYLRQRYLRMH